MVGEPHGGRHTPRSTVPRVLIVDDDPLLRRICVQALEGAGYTVSEAADGEEAVKRYRECHCDVILMDMQMPTMDGYAATSLLRSEGYTGPIIALTAHAMSGDREKCLAAGCNDYATKPLDRPRLLHQIARLTGAVADNATPAGCL